MTNHKKFTLYPAMLLLALLAALSAPALAASGDSTLFFRSDLSVTQNGFSFIPSFSLGKPAVILEPSIGNKRLSFEPQFRFAMEGKPWSFIFIYRYKLVARQKFQLLAGFHVPSIVFSTQTVTTNGTSQDVIVSRRFVAAELLPNYVLNENVSVGVYLLRGHGFDPGIRNSYYAGLRSTIRNISLGGPVLLRVIPQFYYLQIDDQAGTYFTNTAVLSVRNFPLSVSNIINRAIQSNINGKDFDWNISLMYSFDKNYISK